MIEHPPPRLEVRERAGYRVAPAQVSRSEREEPVEDGAADTRGDGT